MRRSHERRCGALLLALALLVSLLAGCTLPHPEPPMPTQAPSPLATARVTRISAFPDNHIAALEVYIASPTKVQQLHAALLALPTTHTATVTPCLEDIGVAYVIVFSSTARSLDAAWVKPDGCRQAKVDTSSALRYTTPQFWQIFADALGVDESVLFDLTPRSSGPYAPMPKIGDWVG